MREKLLVRVMLVAALAICCHACTDKDEAVPSQPKAEELSTNPHAISQEQALASLRDFLASFEDGETRSAMQGRRVKDIYPVEFHEDATRAANGDAVDCENLLYVVNFENEQGYAILAADDRVKDDVLAVVEEGSMSASTMKAAAGRAVRVTRPIFSSFPTEGPGYFQSPRYADEIFVNPNTVDLADSTGAEKDTLAGNFDPMGATITEPEEPTGPVFNPTDKKPLIDLNGELTGEFVYDKARNDLYDENKEGTGKDTWKRNPNGSMEIKYGDWQAVKTTATLLQDFKNWDQHAPYNSLYPMRSNWSEEDVVDMGKAYVGCVPLALAKVVLYMGVPQSYNGIDMLQLRDAVRDGKWNNKIPELLFRISEDCHAKYFRNGTFCFPFRAKRFFNNHGYSNAEKKDYSFSIVTSMIDKSHPLIMVSIPRFHITRSHCWNIDGYKILKRDITYTYYDSSGKVTRTNHYVDEHNMVHCDFGWGGRHNGYYTSGVFKLDDQDAEYDNVKADNSLHTHCNNYKKIIYYDCAK